MKVGELLDYNQSVEMAPGWWLYNMGNYALLKANSSPYENMDARIKLDAPKEFVYHMMGGAREIAFEIPGHGLQWEWDLYRVYPSEIPHFTFEERHMWLYKEPVKIDPPRLKAKEGFYAHKEF